MSDELKKLKTTWRVIDIVRIDDIPYLLKEQYSVYRQATAGRSNQTSVITVPEDATKVIPIAKDTHVQGKEGVVEMKDRHDRLLEIKEGEDVK